MKETLVPIFRAKDARETAKWYARLGFEVEGEHQFAPGMPYYLFLKRGDNLLHLSEHKGDARPDSDIFFPTATQLQSTFFSHLKGDV